VDNYGRRIVVDLDFDRVTVEILHAFQLEHLDVIARIDVREHVRSTLGHDFRRYLLLEAWSPDLMLAALKDALEVGPILPTTFAIYELADGETVVVASEPLSPYLSDPACMHAAPRLAELAEREAAHMAGVLRYLQEAARKERCQAPAA
jgi:uncharacterized protein (DUF302 family)